jgi:dolichol-phosphate mannosyltransferase
MERKEMPPELVVVMPVYNEEACVVGVVGSWRSALSELGVRFRILVLNDGSKDGTRQALEAFASDPSIQVINKANSGHGPTILTGYRQAVEMAPWVFQCDSDDEMPPDSFPQLWATREEFDALFGIRDGREQNVGRKFISAFSRATVRLLFGSGVKDVNVPYRLMRSRVLKPILETIPTDTFAPNVLISGSLARAGLRVANIAVPYKDRQTGAVSIMRWKLWRMAAKSFWQTLRYVGVPSRPQAAVVCALALGALLLKRRR